MLVLLRFASRCNSPRISHNFNKQSEISLAVAGLRNGSKIEGVAANLPNNPRVSEASVDSDKFGANHTSICRTSPATRRGAWTSP